ncbi:MAG TPA: hypothetical protein VGC50_08070, partial [Gammaproteobacteria bacterium]
DSESIREATEKFAQESAAAAKVPEAMDDAKFKAAADSASRLFAAAVTHSVRIPTIAGSHSD